MIETILDIIEAFLEIIISMISGVVFVLFIIESIILCLKFAIWFGGLVL